MEDARYGGLTQKEVKERINAGKTNQSDASTGLTVKQIILSNTLTYFNLIFLVITVLLCIVGSFRNLTFLPIILWNIIIGIIQEWRAKKTLDKMNLLNAPHAIVVRDGKESKVTSEELVQDDVVLLSAGEQICADATVLEGNVQVNESLLTGESDEIDKKKGDTLLSGSFVVSGRCHARLDKVGNESYISKLTSEAKTIDGYEQSEMVRSINEIIKWVGIVIIPIGVILFYQSFFLNGVTFQKSITSMVAAVLGMIPEGLYLLTTVALALSTMRLSKRKVLLHDMKSIETLARVDVLCVDKTGTITEPEMKVKEVVFEEDDVTERLTDYVLASKDNNATMQALQAFVPENAEQKHAALKVVPFTSSTKYGGIIFDDATYLLGAPEFIMRSEFEKIEDKILPYTDKGYRALLFAKYDGTELEHGLSGSVEPLAYVIFENPIRQNAKQTFEYFKKQKVAIKVISGDNPKTVSEISEQAGIDGARNYVDASTLTTDAQVEEALETKTVFGRVTPKQKQAFVSALQKNGHTVAMTGDGVNDIFFAISPLSRADFLLVVVFMFAADSILRHLTHATERIARKIRRKRQDLPRHFGRKG